MKNSLMAICCAAMLCLLALQPLEAKKKVAQKSVYMVGVAFVLTDSTVYLTDMHLVDSVTIEKKTKFLMDRQLYSFQLQRYLQQAYKGGPYVPSVFFSPNRKKMERKYLALHKRYVQSKEFGMVLVDQGQFRFKPEKYVEVEEKPVTSSKKKKSKKKS